MFKTATRIGESIPAGRWHLAPVARSLRLDAPWFPGGVVWNRPVGVAVRAPDGKESLVPVHDRTRQLQVALWGLGLLGSFWIWRRRR